MDMYNIIGYSISGAILALVLYTGMQIKGQITAAKNEIIELIKTTSSTELTEEQATGDQVKELVRKFTVMAEAALGRAFATAVGAKTT